uniref:F-box domain-containing protein n=1 Tax=Mycena chlorophos TaxID=658473 RepID=A0ABQ0M8D7_MYCCL|nr:predicted protein [Mycena chlorophos]
MSSPFSAHLRTNYRPTDDEREGIDNFLVEPRARLREIDEQIEKLRTERADITAQIQAHEALKSPIRCLPDDLLQEIFLHCLSAERNPAMSAVEAPVLLGRICGAWRLLVFSTPALWSRIHIVEPLSGATSLIPAAEVRKTKAAKRVAAAKAWLERSGNYPLSISFHQKNTPFDGLPTNATAHVAYHRTELLRIMVKHSLRWAKVEFSFPLQDREMFEDLSHLAVKDVPLLKSFRLKSTNQINAGTIPWTSLRFLQTPTLKSFFVSFGGLAMDLKNIHIRWNQLTTLEIAESPGAEFPAHEILSILDKCPALRWCQLTLPQWPRYLHTQQAVHSQSTKILCPELRRLGISGTFEILSSLFCPQLRHLVIGEIRDEYSIPRDHNEMSDIGPLLHILSSSSLLEIFNCRATISKANLGIVFRALPPALLKLGIFDDPSNPQVDDELLHDLAEQQRCPLLEDIYFYKYRRPVPRLEEPVRVL